jgi:hypothetical protein
MNNYAVQAVNVNSKQKIKNYYNNINTLIYVRAIDGRRRVSRCPSQRWTVQSPKGIGQMARRVGQNLESNRRPDRCTDPLAMRKPRGETTGHVRHGANFGIRTPGRCFTEQ